MVTGDNIITAKAIAKEIGLFTDEGSYLALEGPEFNKSVGGIVCKNCKVAICDCPTTADQAEEQKKEIRVDTVANG
jgi:magnesium-transporting ATPase (P-type)